MTTFSIIGGTGALGAGLAKRLLTKGHEVWIGSRDPAKAAAFAVELGSPLAHGAGLSDAAARGEICFLCVPYAAHADTLTQIRDSVQGKVVVDATVPLKPPKVGTVQLPAAGCAALETAAALGEGVKIVSALQTVGAEKLDAGGSIDGDVLVSGDDAEAVEQVRAVLTELGMVSWHVGPLANAAAAEAMTSVLIQINRRYKRSQSGLRITGKPKDAAGEGGSEGVSVKPVKGLPLIKAGDDLAAMIADAIGPEGLQNGDVVVVAQKIVSKAEDRAVDLASVEPGPTARDISANSGKDAAVVELMMRDSVELMRVVPNIVITRHKTGHVLANAGIDASNVTGESDQTVLVWPVDPDASARAIRAALEARFGVRLAVIVSDSLGRAWRVGTTGTAIGVAGLKPLRDRRGEHDLFGRELQATIIGVADEIASAASLVIGEAAEGTPCAIVRGAVYDACDDARAADGLRPVDQDLFR